MVCQNCGPNYEVSLDGFCMNCHHPVAGGGGDEQPTTFDYGQPGEEYGKAEGGGGYSPDGGTVIVAGAYNASGGSDAGTTYVEKSAIALGGVGQDDPRLPKGPKLIGWLVSFSYDPHGKDYRLHEGRTAIGRDQDMEVQIDYDNDISRRHCIIMYREGRLTLTDDFSQNGTKLNGKFIDGGVPMELSDRDQIDLGITRFTVYLVD